mmetsp:Transcript_22020/g.45532  ORF Transcript_22020/g.45532 Transcript_22020/m.45532 type:complete len:95 (+) Transcript_22020:116-400(+)
MRCIRKIRSYESVGENSFFQQLDRVIAALANEDFQRLYELTEKATGGATPSSEDIKRYSNYKAAIFTRYRTLSEIRGILLICEAGELKSNVMAY